MAPAAQVTERGGDRPVAEHAAGRTQKGLGTTRRMKAQQGLRELRDGKEAGKKE